MTAGDRYFPTVLAREWHGACRSLAVETASGIVDLMSSKSARLRRRHEARRKQEKRLRKSGRMPQHTKAERRRAEAERQCQREADQRRQVWLGRVVLPVVTSASAASIMFLPLAGASSGHHSYPYLSAAELAWPDNPELPHMPESDMTFDTPWAGPGTASVNVAIGPVFPTI